NVQNGDIILLSGDTPGEKTCRWCTGTIFSHVGFLFREKHPVTGEDIPYVLDCDLGQKTKSGVRVLPLRDKLHRYKGFRSGAVKKLIVKKDSSRPSIEDIVRVIAKYTPIEFDNNVLSWWVSGIPSLYS